MKINLEELESRLQSLIEVRLVKMLPGRKVEDLVAQQLATAMKSKMIVKSDTVKLAPNVFTLILHPDTAKIWQEDPKLLDTLREALRLSGEEAGLTFSSPPDISISTDENLAVDEVNVLASHKVEAMAETKGDNLATSEAVTETIPENAFLIIDGVKVFPLNQPVINIGRRLENQLVIDDPRVSRNHAQLRAIKGRFVLFDLNSTGGTYVNSQRTNQSVLYPGDVISLAGVPLIFGQDNPPVRPDLKDTSPLNSDHLYSDRPTAILRRDTQELPKDE
jgi:pSer/pThr/pTyr-binding forkhead associated (FHA) protein